MNFGLVNKPKSPGATMRVWEIADDITRRSGREAKRKEVIEAYVSEGGNLNTASTQYYYWKTARAEEKTGEVHAVGSPPPKRLKVADNGALTLSSEITRCLDLGPGDVVEARVVNGEIRLISTHELVRRAKGALADMKAGEESIVDEFLAGRRASWGEE